MRRKDLQQLARQAISTLRREEQLGKDVVLIYAGEYFGVLCLDDYSLILVELEPESKQKLKEIMANQREVRLKRDSHRIVHR